MTEIQVCPFCGSNEVERINISRCVEPVFVVVCRECGVTGTNNLRLHESDNIMKDEAIVAWNRAR